MKIKTIFDRETENAGTIHLYKEGIFWKAYERSTFMFIENVKSYTVKKRHIKRVAADIVSLGFPDSALPQILKDINENRVKKEEKHIALNGYTLNITEYENWKEAIALEVTTKTPSVPVSSYASPTRSESLDEDSSPLLELSPTSHRNTDNFHTGETESILRKITGFDVVNKTPIECQQFIIEMQKELHGVI